MQINVAFSGTKLSDYARRVSELGAQGDIEMSRGLNDAGAVVLTQVRRALQGQMGVTKAGVVREATNAIPAIPARFGMVYTITASGKGLPIQDFPVSAQPGGPVTASPWGMVHTFARSFVTSKRGLLRARRTDAREPIRSLRGPSPSKELVKDASLDTFQKAVPALVEPIIVRRLARLMP